MSALTARFHSRVEPPDRLRPQINAARVLGHQISFSPTVVRRIGIPTHVARVYAKVDSRLVITNQRSLQIVHMDACAYVLMFVELCAPVRGSSGTVHGCR